MDLTPRSDSPESDRMAQALAGLSALATEDAVARLSQALGHAADETAPGVEAERLDGAVVRALVADDRTLTPRLIEHIVAEGGEVRAVEVLHSTLRDAFLLKTGRALDA